MKTDLKNPFNHAKLHFTATSLPLALIRERIQAELAAARARGRVGGRREKLSADKQRSVVQLYNEKKMTVQQLCDMMGISKPTLYSYVRANQTADG